MKKISYLLFCVIFFACCKTQNISQTKHTDNDNYVVVLSMDGFRADYPEMYHTPTLDSLAKVGVRSELIPSFPSLTFPNHYAMATGLYPDTHGLIHNTFITPQGETYRISDREAVENPAFYQGEPIWNTAQRQGVRAASFFWVGSETAINGRQPWRWKRYTKSVTYDQRADSVLAWLSLPEKERPRLIMWYLDEPDHTGHHYAPESEETRRMVQHVDSVLGRFLYKMNQLPIADKINFVLVSDHGMAGYRPEKYINLADYMPTDSFRFIVEGAPTLLYPNPEYADTAYKILKKIPGLQVWRKGEVPEKYHYGSHPSIGELVVLPEIGSRVEFRNFPPSDLKGGHGFDNFAPEMRAIFYFSGPAFSKGAHAEAVENVNVYLLLCRLLGIQPAPNHGSDNVVTRLMKK